MSCHSSIAILLILSLPISASAECLYADARAGHMQVSNLQAALAREQNQHIQQGREVPVELGARIDALESELKPLRDAFTAVVEAQALSIREETPVDASFCSGFSQLLQKHAPEGYSSKPITLNAAAPLACEGMDSTELWQRYSEAMQAQMDLVQSGRVDHPQVLQLSEKFSRFGTEMTTDAGAACATLAEIERDVAALAQ